MAGIAIRDPMMPIHAGAFLFFLENLSARIPAPIVEIKPQIP